MRLSQSCNVTAISSPINGLYKSKRTLSPPCGGATALRVAVEGFFSIPLKISTLVCPAYGSHNHTTSRPLAAGKDDSDEKQEPIDVCFDRRAGGPVDNPGGCAGPAKETASSAAQGQAASSAASQTEETGGETESLPPEENAGVLPQEEAGQAAPRTEAAPDTSASAKSSASSASRAPERQPEASASRSSSTTAASRPATSPSRTQSPAATTRRPTTTSTAKTTRFHRGPPPSRRADGSLSGYADAVVKLVNQERAKAGLKSLSVNQAAAAAANVRAREIEGAFSHTRPNGSSFSTALKEQGASYRAAGENIAYGQRSAEQVMEGWMNSSGHRANILNAQYTAIGVGVYRSASGTLHWVQLFIG